MEGWGSKCMFYGEKYWNLLYCMTELHQSNTSDELIWELQSALDISNTDMSKYS